MILVGDRVTGDQIMIKIGVFIGIIICLCCGLQLIPQEIRQQSAGINTTSARCGNAKRISVHLPTLLQLLLGERREFGHNSLVVSLLLHQLLRLMALTL